MNQQLVPKLKREVTIDKFDSSMISDSYLLSYGSRQWQISEIVYNVIVLVNGRNSVEEICSQVNTTGGPRVDPESVHYILQELLWKKGVLEGSENTEAPKKSLNQSLWLRGTLMKGEIVEKFRFLGILYHSKIFVYLAGLALISQLYLLSYMLHPGTYQTVLNTNGKGFLYLLGVGILVTLFHELGHASAAMHYKIIPGSIGFGIYYVMPVFYSDVTKVWKLSRMQRVVVDIGGIYFHSLLLLLIYGCGWFFSNPYLMVCAIVLSIETVLNLNPFIKLDGYWILSDLTGIPNLQEQMKKFLASKVRGLLRRKEEAKFNLPIGKKEKIFFYIYVISSSLFMIFFFYWIFSMAYTVLSHLDKLKAIVMVDYKNLSIWSAAAQVARNIFNNFVYLISLFFVGRIAYGFGGKLIRSIAYAVQRRVRHEKTDRGISENS
ncbi:hypothetical protein KDC22_04985 [Paenibacillus tritici]|uniref:hypothetical protein n=1 Tax=Paenibacillus tritici TaxID=1873425 RepID=UPI001BACF083|nr:hypothetical protein [Paenibacillus tritici]QUL55904.1 hypothetical protein KDC22_04985 [Paenibacillus tritici]